MAICEAHRILCSAHARGVALYVNDLHLLGLWGNDGAIGALVEDGYSMSRIAQSAGLLTRAISDGGPSNRWAPVGPYETAGDATAACDSLFEALSARLLFAAR